MSYLLGIVSSKSQDIIDKYTEIFSILFYKEYVGKILLFIPYRVNIQKVSA